MEPQEATFGRLLHAGLSLTAICTGEKLGLVQEEFGRFLSPRKSANTIGLWMRPDSNVPASEREEVAIRAVRFCLRKSMLQPSGRLKGQVALLNQEWATSLMRVAGVDSERIERELAELGYRSTVHSAASEWVELKARSRDDDLLEKIRESREVWAWGGGFVSHAAIFEANLWPNICEEDKKVRFLLMEPGSSAVEVAAVRAGIDRQRMEAGLWRSLLRLYDLHLRVEAEGQAGGLELRVLPYVGTTMYVFPHPADGIVFLHLPKFRGHTPLDRPTIYFPSRSPWFRYCVAEFETAWMMSRPFDPGRYPAPS